MLLWDPVVKTMTSEIKLFSVFYYKSTINRGEKKEENDQNSPFGEYYRENSPKKDDHGNFTLLGTMWTSTVGRYVNWCVGGG